MHIEPRNGASIDRIYIHKNEGPEAVGGAVALGRYLDTIDGGYHKIRDNAVTVTKAADDQIVWGEGGDNLHALSICILGWSSQTAAQWAADPYAQAEFVGAAKEVATWCRVHNIPAVHVAPGAPGAAPTQRGIAEHADDHDPASQGHTDPGVGFPIEKFVEAVAAELTKWNALVALVGWDQRVSATGLYEGQSSHDITALKQMLHQIGEGAGIDDETSPVYGAGLAKAVAAFKAKHNLENRDGSSFGAKAAAELLKLLYG